MASVEAAVALHRYKRGGGAEDSLSPPWRVRIAVLRGAQDLIARNFPAAAPLLFPYDDFSRDLDAILSGGNAVTDEPRPLSGSGSSSAPSLSPLTPPPPPPTPDVIVATYFVTVWMALKAAQRVAAPPARSQSIPVAYFVQDYEPRFGGLPAEAEIAAALSYVVAPRRVTVVAYSDWVRRELFARHGTPSLKVSCHPRRWDGRKGQLEQQRGVDAAAEAAARARGGGTANNLLTVVAMLRPSTPRRAPWRTARVLLRVLQEAAAMETATRVQVITFGCSKADLRALWDQHRGKSDPAACPFDHRGMLSHDAVLALFHGLSTLGGARFMSTTAVDAHGRMAPDSEGTTRGRRQRGAVFLDLSRWQAFGFTGLEAMAEGVVPVVRAGSGSSYATHLVNAIVVAAPAYSQGEGIHDDDDDDDDKGSEQEDDGAAVGALLQLLRDPDLLARLQVGARNTVRDRYTPAGTARSWHAALGRLLQRRDETF